MSNPTPRKLTTTAEPFRNEIYTPVAFLWLDKARHVLGMTSDKEDISRMVFKVPDDVSISATEDDVGPYLYENFDVFFLPKYVEYTLRPGDCVSVVFESMAGPSLYNKNNCENVSPYRSESIDIIAESSSPTEITLLAEHYFQGNRVPRNVTQAFGLLERAEQQFDI